MFFRNFAKIVVVVLSIVNLSAMREYMPGSFYNNNDVNYIYTKVWTIDKTATVTRITDFKKLSGRSLFYLNMRKTIVSDILSGINRQVKK